MEGEIEVCKTLIYSERKESDLFDYKSKLDYQKILRYLADGYLIENLKSEDVKEEEIQIFLKDLENNNLTIDNVKAINQYSNRSDIILGIKKGLISKGDVINDIIYQLNSSLKYRGTTSTNIEKINCYILQLDYTKPLYLNYNITGDYIKNLDLPMSTKATILSAVKNLDILNRIDEIIFNLEDALLKSSIKEDIKVYRAIKDFPIEKIDNLNGQIFPNDGFVSTTPFYNSSFAKYESYNTVFEIYISEGTLGLDINRFSDYSNVENEILLNNFDLYIFDVKLNITDENLLIKNIIKGYAVSRTKKSIRR